MRAPLLTLLPMALMFGAAAQAQTRDQPQDRPQERPTLRAVARRAADGTLIYGDGRDVRRAPAPAAKEWQG